MNINKQTINKRALAVFILLLIAICLVGALSGDRLSGKVYISEVCPHNAGIMYDSVGFYHDFIEITNPTSQTVNLSGYGLSDDSSNLMKYVFPDVELSAGASRIIWADIDSAYYDAVGTPFEDDNGLYTQFSLKDHEMLYLTDPDGYVVDSVRIPEMKDDMALSRSSSKDKGVAGPSKYSKEVTPVLSSLIDPPALSAVSGYYPTSFELIIDGNGNEVLYTLDGSDPAVNGMRYVEPLLISDRSALANLYANIKASNTIEQPDLPPVSKAFIVRAVSKSADGAFSEEKCATYFIGNDIYDICKGTYTLSIVSDPDGLFSDEKGICVPGNTWEMNRDKAREAGVDLRFAPANFNMRGRHWRRKASLMLFDENLKCLYDEEGTINVRGATSRFLLQKSFAVKPIVEGQKVFDGLIPESGDSFDLRIGGEDEAYLTNFRDTLNSAIAGDMDVCAQRSVCCQVYLNGEYWGCYNLQDHINTSLIEARYGVAADNVNLIKNHNIESGLDIDYEQYQDMEGFAKNNDFSDDANYEKFCMMVDIDSLIDYYIAEIFFANHDAYINNVGMWRARTPGSGVYEDGRWRFLLFDTDDSDSIWEDTSNKDTFVSGNWMGVNPDTELFFSNLSKNQKFRARFRERFSYLMENDLSFASTGPVIDEFETVYSRPMVRSMQRFGKEEASLEQYGQNVEVVRSFFRNRCDNIGKYLMQHMGD